MPAKNVRKQYVEDAYYHIYNRGVEKRTIFQDHQDYSVFISYLKDYLLPKDEKLLMDKFNLRTTTPAEKEKISKLLQMNNFAGEINLIAYCLMPNHFHFLVKQKNADSIDKFMNSAATRYVMYFNRKYNRVGPLYQGTYKAVLVESDKQLLYLTRYIHKQAVSRASLSGGGQPSSYPIYIGNQSSEWVNSEPILDFFSQGNPKLSYKSFVEEAEDIEPIYDLILEE